MTVDAPRPLRGLPAADRATGRRQPVVGRRPLARRGGATRPGDRGARAKNRLRSASSTRREGRAARPARAVRGPGSDRPGRDGRGPQGVRPGAEPVRRDQGAAPRARRRTAAARRRFAREAQGGRGGRATSTSSPSTPSTSAGGLPYLVMQYVAGQSLQERLDQTGPLESTEILRIGMQAAAGPGRGARSGAGPPRHQAGQHPAGERRRAGQAHRLRPGPGRRRRQPDAERRRRRHAAVHGPRAGPRRAGRPPRRPVQPGQRPLRHVHRPPAVPRTSTTWPSSGGSATTAPADPRAQPRGPRLAGRDHRQAARQGPGRPVPVGRRGRRAARPVAGPHAEPPQRPRPEPTRSVSAIRRPSLRRRALAAGAIGLACVIGLARASGVSERVGDGITTTNPPAASGADSPHAISRSSGCAGSGAP